jgi:hypothetical protein
VQRARFAQDPMQIIVRRDSNDRSRAVTSREDCACECRESQTARPKRRTVQGHECSQILLVKHYFIGMMPAEARMGTCCLVESS